MKHLIDITAALTTALAILHWMPEISALLAAIWYSIRIGEWLMAKFHK